MFGLAHFESVTLHCHLLSDNHLMQDVTASNNNLFYIYSGDDTFTIQHNSNGKCLLVQDGALKLGDCSSVPAVSWKWGSTHRLFHVESSMCLGLEVRSKVVTLFSCDSNEILHWKCYEDIIYTEYQMKLSVGTNDSVTAKRDGQDTWKRGGSSENICQQPYRRMHTSGGNSNGAPCEFPFLYNGTWHHNCLPGTEDKTLDWCSTTANYDQDKKWGNCLKYVEGCSTLWEKDPVKGRCYQVVSTAVVTWHEARDACRSQGGDLLSVSSPQELEFYRKDLPSKLWIGLNHLDWMQGWQLADGSALSFAPWETGDFNWTVYYKESYSRLLFVFVYDFLFFMSLYVTDLKTEVWIGLLGDGTTSVYEWVDKVPVSFTYWARAQPPPLLPNATHCVYYAGEHHTWSVSDCDNPRAYMCKKKGIVNESAPEEGCPPDGNWKRHGDACYKVDTELVFYKNSCHITINNRFEQAFINSLLKELISTEVLYFWTGLQDTKGSRQYQWIGQDGTADQVAYTNWKWLEPAFPGGCVVMSTGHPLGQWAVKNCTLFKAGNICKKPIKSMVQPTPDPIVPNPNASCAPGWVSREGLKHCYKVFHGERLTRKRSWEEAERFCEALGGHLPSFTEAKDIFFFLQLPLSYSPTYPHTKPSVSMMIFPDEFNEDDAYNRDCVAFKTLKGTYKPFLFLLFHKVPPRSFYPSTFHCDAKLEWVCQIPRGHTPKTPEWYNPDGHHDTSVFIDGQEFWFVTEPKLPFEEAVLYCSSNSSKLAAPDTLSAVHRLQEHLFEVPKGADVSINPELQGCYWVLSDSYYQSFKEASEFCERLKGTLLTISDQVEQDFITTLLPELPGQPQKVWIGLKIYLHGIQWVDNSPLEYLNFNPLLHGQTRPIFINASDTMEICAYMYNDDHSDLMGTWDFTSCSDRQNVSICQHYADKPEEPDHKDNFTVHSHTFKVVQQDNLTWIEALQLCQSYNMDLASIPDAYVQAVLTVEVSRRRQPLWIGLFSEDEGEHFHWTDHSHAEFSRWTSEATKGACVYLDTDGFWKATECDEELSGAICHIPHNKTVTPEVDSFKCPHKSNGQNWIRFKKNCYTLLLGASRWGNDEINEQPICKSLAGFGEILTIRDEEENDFIRQQLQPFKNLVMFVWLGMNKNKTDEQLKWLDGSNVQFSNWKSGQRPNITEPFMVGLNLNGEWEMITNQRFFNSFRQQSIVVCKNENVSKDEFMKGVVDVNTPDGISYRRVAKRMDWYQALQECGSNGGHLASIPDKTTNDNMALIAKRDGFSLWIGLSKQDVSGWPFEWSDGSAVKFTPDGFVNDGRDSEEKCVFVDSKGTWTAVNCHVAQEGIYDFANVTLWHKMLHIACADPGSPVALVFFIIVFICIVVTVSFILYQKNKHRFHSTVRYQRNFDDADSASMINDAE
uniref:Lymphocyte antigen 75-like n=1 Tax=Sinocyclocheilus rhinocerous TaxID=307959 RepID=A0A673JKY1_9TELE